MRSATAREPWDGVSAPAYTVDELVAYFAATRPLEPPVFNLVGAINSEHITTEGIATLLERCPVDAAGFDFSSVRDAAERSCRTDPALLEQWVREADGGPCQAAANPALGPPVVAELWGATRLPGLLKNPNIDHAVLWENLDGHVYVICENPAAPPELIRRCALLANRPAVLLSPACPGDLLDAAFAAAGRDAVWAAMNPRLSVEDLVRLSGQDLDRNSPLGPHIKSANTIVAERLELHAAHTNPLDAQTYLLGHLDVVDPLAEVLFTGGDTADAVTALLRGGFTGTIGELLTCAAAATN